MGSVSNLYRDRCRPELGELLQALCLDRIYTRASGDHLYFQDEAGREVEVIDFVGGFGASIFGHNHPALLAVARRFLDTEGVFNGQGSCRAGAAAVADKLNAMLAARVGREFVATFASTGTEAAEAAIKHALLERRVRLERLADELGRRLFFLRRRHAAGKVQLGPDWGAEASRLLCAAENEPLEQTFSRVTGKLEEECARPPVFVALKRAFHGKTLGALQLTWHEPYRAPFGGFGPPVVFVDPGDEDALRRAVAEHAGTFCRVSEKDQALSLEERPLSRVAALFAEPLQGEAGICEVPERFLAECRRLADAHGFPLVLDEIQCGMGRTGTFLCSEQQNLRADYYLLGKSLGGSLSKISCLLVDAGRYRPEFSRLHTSTFAEDDFSASLALAALDLLDGDPAIGRAVAEKGRLLKEGLARASARYPGVVREIRGRGLMIGVEFAPVPPSDAKALEVAEQEGFLGLLATAYLLHEHRVRVAPTLSNANTIRLEPSAFISESDIGRLLGGFERLCEAIAKRNSHELFKFLVGGPPTPPEGVIADCRRTEPERPASRPRRKVGFIGHFITSDDLAHWDPSFAAFSPAERERFSGATRRLLAPYVYPPVAVRSATGEEVDFYFIGLNITSAQITALSQASERRWFRDRIEEAVGLAIARGLTVLGLGGYTSIWTGNGTHLPTDAIALTSGNALTVAMALRGIAGEALRSGVDPAEATVAVVGAGGNIGSVYSRIIADRVKRLLLFGRNGHLAPLERLASALGGRAAVEVSGDMDRLREADIIVSASNASEPIIFARHLKRGPVIINDVSVPPDVDPGVPRDRPDAVRIQGGLVRLPPGNRFAIRGLPLEENVAFACMAETMLLGLADARAHFSYGPIDPGQVRAIDRLADAHGFSLAGPKRERSY